MKSAMRHEHPTLASTDNRNTDTTRYLVALPTGENFYGGMESHVCPQARLKHLADIGEGADKAKH